MPKKIITHVLLFVVVFALAYFYFLDQKTASAITFIKQRFTNTIATEQEIKEEPKTEACPLNGALYGKSQRVNWETRRPLGIMVENSIDARPQSGLSSADVVFEAVAEGGITRFLAVFYCQDSEIIGPVRSARVYFLDLIGGFGLDPLYAHVGGANTPGPADALGQIEDEGWAGYNDLNQFSVGFPVFWRDYERLPGVATEHTMYTNSQKLYATALERGLSNKNKKGKLWNENYQSWEFKEDASLAQRPAQQKIRFGFWERYHNFDVVWTYNQNTNLYSRTNGGKLHLDKNTKEQLTTKNVVIVFAEESVAQDGYEKGQHLLYEVTGSGRALVFQNGKAIKANWEKEDRYSQILLFDENEDPIKFVAGQIWFEVIPSDNKVTY